ncbi:MAG: M48 family metallopeptidase [Lachnospiraceae bacterium]|nr:M48 family metallopeptidase [Lachnospiraceae bacterium]
MKATIVRSRRKTIAIELVSPEEIRIKAPLRMPRREIEAFVRSKENWIRTHQARLAERNRKAAALTGTITEEELARLKKEAKKYLPGRTAYFAEKIGVTYGQISIRAQKTRFGSCSAKGNLNFNCLLMKMPPEIIDYVIVHELCHRRQMNHSRAFWSEVEKILPDWRARRKWLKENGGAYIRAMESIE